MILDNGAAQDLTSQESLFPDPYEPWKSLSEERAMKRWYYKVCLEPTEVLSLSQLDMMVDWIELDWIGLDWKEVFGGSEMIEMMTRKVWGGE